MFTRVMPLDGKPSCATPEGLALVDAAFEHKAGPEAQRLRERVCPGCPVRTECLLLAMVDGEHGPWGGTSSKTRTRLGAPSARIGRNVRHLDNGIRRYPDEQD